MLFDLSSPRRKTAMRIIYGVLAFLFLIGFVGFGIGGEVGGGGIIDSLTGSGGSSSTSEQYEQQIEDAEEKLESDPENPNALTTLARYRYLSGSAQLEQDPTTGAVSLTEESRQEFEAAIETWSRYLETDPAKPDVATAGNIVQAYVQLDDAEGAAAAQEILAEANPSGGTYAQLALYRYADFDMKGGDEAADKALKAAKPDERKELERQLEQIAQRAAKQEKALEKLPDDAAGGEGALDDPFSGLDPSGTGAPAPIAP